VLDSPLSSSRHLAFICPPVSPPRYFLPALLLSSTPPRSSPYPSENSLFFPPLDPFLPFSPPHLSHIPIYPPVPPFLLLFQPRVSTFFSFPLPCLLLHLMSVVFHLYAILSSFHSSFVRHSLSSSSFFLSLPLIFHSFTFSPFFLLVLSYFLILRPVASSPHFFQLFPFILIFSIITFSTVLS